VSRTLPGAPPRPGAAAPRPTEPPAPARPLLLWTFAALAGLLVGLAIGGAWWDGPAPGAPDPGAVVGWGLPIARTVQVLAAAATFGWLLSAAFLAPGGRRGMLSTVGRADVRRSAYAAAVWFVAATMTMLFNHAMAVALPLHEALAPGVLTTYLFALDTSVAFAVTALAALVVLAAAPFTSRTGGALVLAGTAAVGIVAPAVSGHSHGLGDHGLAIASGLGHSLASAAWLGTLLATAVHVLRRDPGVRTMLPRYGVVANLALVVLALSGAGAAYARVERAGDLLTTPYGHLVLAKIAVLAALAFGVHRSRRALAADSARTAAGRGRAWRWIFAEGLLLAVGAGLAVALTRTPNTRIPVPLASPGEELLGFAFPPPPTASTVLFGWHPDPFWILVVVGLVVGYLWGLRTLLRRGDRWPVGRTVSWMLGLFFLGWATNGEIAAYSQVSVALHMLQHMVIAMLAPVFLVLGAPITLALRTIRPSRSGDRGPREWILWSLHSRVARFVTHPVYLFVVAVLGLFVLYFTPLFPWLMSNHLGHLLMQLHFLISGYLFYWVIIGIDPQTREVPHWAKMILLLASLAIHGFFGILIMMMTEPLGAAWYSQVQPPWLVDAQYDTYVAGGIAWALGELPTMIVLVALSVQWARSDERLQRRIDRTADRTDDAELKAYNARLARLAERSAAQERQG
jgi:putative copper resistance protein D